MTQTIVTIITIALAIWGWRKGLVTQIGSLAAVAVALVACQVLGDPVTDAFLPAPDPAASPLESGTVHRFATSFITHTLIFTIVFAGMWILARTLKAITHALHLGMLDRLGGAAFMMLKGGLVMSIIMNLARILSPQSTLATADGWLISGIRELAPVLMGYL